MIFRTALLIEEVLVGLSLDADGKQQEKEVHSEHKSQQSIEDLCETDQLDRSVVFGGKVDQTQEEEQFGSLCDVEMSTDVFSLMRFTVDSYKEVERMHHTNSYNGVKRVGIEESDHHSQ